jgi:hypothetical protein
MAEAPGSTPFFLILRAAGFAFALPGTAVRGVLEATSDSLLGGIGSFSADLTYLDAHRVFRGRAAGGRFARYAAVVESGDKRVALGVDTPGRVAPASEAQVLPFPVLLRRSQNQMLAGFLRVGSEMTVLLDPERLADAKV